MDFFHFFLSRLVTWENESFHYCFLTYTILIVWYLQNSSSFLGLRYKGLVVNEETLSNQKIPLIKVALNLTFLNFNFPLKQSCYYSTSPASTTVSQHASSQQSLPLQPTAPQSTPVLQRPSKQAPTQQHLQQQPQIPPTSQQQFPVKSEQQRTQVSQQSQQRLSSSQQKQQQPPPSQQLAKQTVDQSITKTTIVHSKLQPVSSVTDLSMTTVAPVMTARPASNVNNNTMVISSTPTTPAMNSYMPVYYTPVCK